MNKNFLANLAELVRLLPQIRELCQRTTPIQEAVVTRNDDPTGFRRIKATRQAQGGQSETDWFPAGRASMFSDEPIPEPGTTVLLGFVDNDPHKPYLIRTLSNATNPPDEGQLDPVKDNTAKIPGNEHRIVEGNVLEETLKEKEEIVKEDCYLTVKGKKLHINAELGQVLIEALNPAVGQVKINADLLASVQSNVATTITSLADVLITAGTSVMITQGGAYVEMKNGAWEFGSESGQSWSFGDGEWTWDCAGNSIRVINCAGFSINGAGNQVIVTGSTDSSNDVNNDRGY